MRTATVILAAALSTAACFRPHAEPVLINGYAAIVNDRVITYHQVERQVPASEIEAARRRYRLQPQAFAEAIARLQQDALRGLIESELILREFETAGYKLPDSMIDEQVKDRIREEFGSRAKAIQSLHARNATIESFRKDIRDDFIVTQMVLKNVLSPVIISPHKIETYYRENQDRFRVKDRVKLHLISLPNRANRDTAATRQLADSLLERLKAGTPFKEVALQSSEDANRAEGGSWGWVERGQLREDLDQLAFSLTPGQLSDVIQKDDGCYLMLIDEFQPAHVQPLPDVRDDIEETLRRRERARLREDWLKRLREKSFVRVFPPR